MYSAKTPILNKVLMFFFSHKYALGSCGFGLAKFKLCTKNRQRFKCYMTAQICNKPEKPEQNEIYLKIDSSTFPFLERGFFERWSFGTLLCRFWNVYAIELRQPSLSPAAAAAAHGPYYVCMDSLSKA